MRCDCKAVKYSNSLQLTATHCSTLQHAATHNDDGADSWEIYQCAVTIELQCTATHCNTLQHTATHNNNDTDFWKYPPDTLYDGLCILLIFLSHFFRWRWLLRISTSYPLWWPLDSPEYFCFFFFPPAALTFENIYQLPFMMVPVLMPTPSSHSLYRCVYICVILSRKTLLRGESPKCRSLAVGWILVSRLKK